MGYPDKEDSCMNPEFLWSLFLDTGAPEVYLLYRRALREEEAIPA